MTNAERRAALNRARQRALEHAEAADRIDFSGEISPADRAEDREFAKMWAQVAQAFKDGSPSGDAADRPSNEYGVIER